jgi:hypothetical protein
VGHVARKEDKINVIKVSVGKHEEKKPLGTSRRKRDINIRMDFEEIRCDSVEWIHLAQVQWRALMNTAISPRVP